MGEGKVPGSATKTYSESGLLMQTMGRLRSLMPSQHLLAQSLLIIDA